MGWACGPMWAVRSEQIAQGEQPSIVRSGSEIKCRQQSSTLSCTKIVFVLAYMHLCICSFPTAEPGRRYEQNRNEGMNRAGRSTNALLFARHGREGAGVLLTRRAPRPNGIGNGSSKASLQRVRPAATGPLEHDASRIVVSYVSRTWHNARRIVA